MRITKLVRHTILVSALLCGVHSSVSAQIIYADPLIGTQPADGSGGSSVNGTSPATDTGGATWTSAGYGPSETVNGLNNWWMGNNLTETATLPLTLDGAGIYTLTVNAMVPYASNGIDFGFTGAGQPNNTSINGTISQAYIDISGYNGGATVYYGQSSSGSNYSATNDITHLFSISLDSSNGTLTFSEDGTAIQTVPNALTSLQMASITGIGLGFGYSVSTAVFTNLSLSEAVAVPEPSTWFMLIGGVLAIALARRRQAVRV